jgi:hypothetical protein
VEGVNMNTGRLSIGLVSAVLIEGSALVLPNLSLSAVWTQWIGIIRLVLLGAVMCGLAVTGGSNPREEPEKKKLVLKKKAGPVEEDMELERMTQVFREKVNHVETPAPIVASPESNDLEERLIIMQKWIDETRANLKKPKPEPEAPPSEFQEPDWKELYLQSQLKNGRKK